MTFCAIREEGFKKKFKKKKKKKEGQKKCTPQSISKVRM